MYCIVLSIRLFSNGEWKWWSSFRNLQACGYQVPPSVDTGCFPWILTKPAMNLSAINMFLSLDMFSAAFLCFQALLQSITRYIQNQLWLVSHQQGTLISSSYNMTTFVDGTFESSSKSIHGFVWQGKQVFQMFSLATGLKSTNTDHSIHTLKVFFFC